MRLRMSPLSRVSVRLAGTRGAIFTSLSGNA
jgi:hypothetical protein